MPSVRAGRGVLDGEADVGAAGNTGSLGSISSG